MDATAEAHAEETALLRVQCSEAAAEIARLGETQAYVERLHEGLETKAAQELGEDLAAQQQAELDDARGGEEAQSAALRATQDMLKRECEEAGAFPYHRPYARIRHVGKPQSCMVISGRFIQSMRAWSSRP